MQTLGQIENTLVLISVKAQQFNSWYEQWRAGDSGSGDEQVSMANAVSSAADLNQLVQKYFHLTRVEDAPQIPTADKPDFGRITAKLDEIVAALQKGHDSLSRPNVVGGSGIYEPLPCYPPDTFRVAAPTF